MKSELACTVKMELELYVLNHRKNAKTISKGMDESGSLISASSSCECQRRHLESAHASGLHSQNEPHLRSDQTRASSVIVIQESRIVIVGVLDGIMSTAAQSTPGLVDLEDRASGPEALCDGGSSN